MCEYWDEVSLRILYYILFIAIFDIVSSAFFTCTAGKLGSEMRRRARSAHPDSEAAEAEALRSW